MGICQANCYKTHNELTLYPLGKCPFAPSVLSRGVTTKVDAEDEQVPVLQQAMEYSGAIGAMVMDELAYVHERTETGLGMAMNGIEREVTRVEDRVSEHETLIEEVQGDVGNLIAGAQTSANIEDALRIEVTGLRHLVSQLMHQVTALEGRPEHPIAVEDSSEDGDDEDDDDGGVDLDEVFRTIPGEENLAPVPVPAPGMVYQLVPIEDLAEEEEVEDSEIEEGLAIEIAALDPAPPYIQ